MGNMPEQGSDEFHWDCHADVVWRADTGFGYDT
jgi:hypothetical protein